jgi:hypothetical protein
MLDLAQNCKALQHELALALRELNVSFQHDEQSLDVVVTPNEINERHGVGVLLPRIFKDTSAMLVLRTTNLYDGRQAFGSHSVCLNVQGLSYTEILLKIQTMFVQRFPHVKVKRILVIPYLTEDFYVAIALKHLFQAPLCAYMMDDQNIYVNNVPDALVENLIGLSELCLAVSQPLCQAYEKSTASRSMSRRLRWKRRSCRLALSLPVVKREGF